MIDKKRTIEISESQYQFFTKLAIAMKTQKNQGTNLPIYCIYDKKEDESIVFIASFFTEKAMTEYLNDWSEDFVNPFTRIRSAAYNDEISELMKFVVSLDDLVLPEHNNKAYE